MSLLRSIRIDVVLAVIGVVVCIVIATIITLPIVLTQIPDDRCENAIEDVRIDNIQFFGSGGGIVISWGIPERLRGCPALYSIVFKSEFEEFHEITDSIDLTVSYNSYCYEFTVSIAAGINEVFGQNTSKTYNDAPAFMGISLKLSEEEPDVVTISFGRFSREELCSLVYEFVYSTDRIGDKQSINASNPEANFNIAYCADAIIDIRVIDFLNIVIADTTRNATIFPSHIQRAKDLIIVSSGQQTWLSWTQVPPIGTCYMSYEVELALDTGVVITGETALTYFMFSESFFCLNAQARVTPVIGDVSGEVAISTITYNIPPVENVQLLPSRPDNTLTISWLPHEKHATCSVMYVVTYEYGSVRDVVTTREPTINFDIAYCTGATVTVTAEIGESAESEGVTDIHYEGDPNTIGQVQDFVIDEPSDGSITVSWRPPLYLSECDLRFTVTANPETTEEATCTGKSSCNISVSDFCPSTRFVVAATSLNDESVIGEPLTDAYICW